MKKLTHAIITTSLYLVLPIAATYPNAHAQLIPGDVASVGLTYVVPDVLVWYNTNQLPGHPFPGYVTNGPVVNLSDQLGNTALGNGNWDQHVSVIGESTFLIGASTFADDGSWAGSTNAIHGGVIGDNNRPNQRHIVVFQPAAGGAPKIGEAFFTDAGQPYRFHTSLRNRNFSGHVAGDPRAGGTNFMTEAMASLWYCKLWFGVDYFNSDGRFSTNLPLYATGYPSGNNNDGECVIYPGFNIADFPAGIDDVQMGTVQTFSLNPSTLAQAPLSKAASSAYGRCCTSNVPVTVCNNIQNNGPCTSACNNGGAGDNWLGYLGDVIGLDNGNFVSVVSDPTAFFGGSPGAIGHEAAVATIFRPDGSVVKDTFLVDPRQISSGNIAAFSGGFCVRDETTFYFYDDNGNLLFTNTVASSGVGFDTSRGDSTRLASDIHSHYVYLAGPVGAVTQLGIWDARTGAFVANAIVSSDLDATSASMFAANVAVDALDRVCVAFEGLPAAGFQHQVMARVLQFDGHKVTFLTPSFFPFVNADNTNNVNANGVLGFITTSPAVTMTKSAICIAAKGFLNSTNIPAAGPNTATETTVYTVITTPIPSAASLGLTNIVPDMLLWYSTNNYYTNGPMTVAAAAGNAGVFDAYDSVLGDSTFVIANVTYSQDWIDGLNDLSFALALQPAVGGPPKLGYEFYDDYGRAFLGVISGRKTGPPGRVAADKRYGAVNFLTGANCNAGNPTYSGTNFQSNSRWSNPAYSSGSTRYDVEQLFALNPPTLAQTPLTLASDFPGLAPNDTFGDVLALDNGNFAIVQDDSSHVVIPQQGATVGIVRPDGSLVTPPFAVDSSVTTPTGIWANCAAFRGGFCVRYHGTLYFFNNSGALQGSVTQSTSGIIFDTTRGDTTRLASDIRSHFVYLAGAPLPSGGTPTTGQPVMLAIWDANTRQFVASANVSSDIPVAQMKVNAVNLAVDALDRITVGWDCIPTPAFGTGTPGSSTQGWQIVARVLAFDGANVSYLTPSFFPFVNNDTSGILSSQGLTTQTPGIAMTTRQICISCKGTVNSTNNPSSGVDTPATTTPGGSAGGINLYTVISHPAPVAAPAPAITFTKSGSNLLVSWPVDDGLFTVQTTPQVQASGTVWTDFTAGNVVPPVTVPISPANKYIRLVRHF